MIKQKTTYRVVHLDEQKLKRVVEIVVDLREGEVVGMLMFLVQGIESKGRYPIEINPIHNQLWENHKLNTTENQLWLIIRLMQVITGHDFIEVSDRRFCRADTKEVRDGV